MCRIGTGTVMENIAQKQHLGGLLLAKLFMEETEELL
jgi:hypothetical protein